MVSIDLILRLKARKNDHEAYEAAVALEQMRERVEDAELGLRFWDPGGDSEYWLRHPVPINRTAG